MGAEAYPLDWPAGWIKTTKNIYRDYARFSTSFAKARDGLMHELELMGAKHIVLSTDVELRQDGLPYASRKEPEDPGAAVYFEYKKKPMVFACDRWIGVKNNVQALRKTVEAIRGTERWGASDMMERAFSGFQALTDQSSGEWWAILGVSPTATHNEVQSAFKKKRRDSHPDRPGGDHDRFVSVQQAWEYYIESVA
ncbi:MAG: DnaJ domain-containing protein [Nitrosomonadaceae bacterium]